jgi:hypothetical protein
MTNEEIILKSVQAHLTPAQRHEIAAAAYTPEQIAHAVEHIPDGLDELAASQVHTFAWWKDNGKSVKRGEKALFTCPLWKYTDKPSNAQIKAAEAAGKEVQPAVHYYPTTSYMFSCLQVESSKPAPAGRFKSIDEIKAYNKMLAEQRRAARVSAAIKTAAEAIAQDVTTEARQAAAHVVVAVEEHHELPELVEAPQPAAKKSSKPRNPDAIQIVLHNDPNSIMEIILPQFFPCSAARLNQLMKFVQADAAHADENTAAIIDALKRIGALSDSKTREACTKNLAALGACKVEKNPVKIPSKPELFETVLTYRDRSRHRHTVEGFRVERCGYTFFVTREIIPQSMAQKCKARRWNIVESRSGRSVATMMHSKAECADWLWKKFDPETLAKINLDAMEREKLAAPLEAIGTAV